MHHGSHSLLHHQVALLPAALALHQTALATKTFTPSRIDLQTTLVCLLQAVRIATTTIHQKRRGIQAEEEDKQTRGRRQATGWSLFERRKARKGTLSVTMARVVGREELPNWSTCCLRPTSQQYRVNIATPAVMACRFTSARACPAPFQGCCLK